VPITRSELEVLYRDLEIPLYNFALRWVFDPALAEDVVHDAFIRVWNRRDEVIITTFKGFIYKTVQNLALNEMRRRRVRSALIGWFEEPMQDSPDQDLALRQELKDMQKALEKLPLELRGVLLLSEFSDMDYRQISTMLGIAEGTVASRKNRALAQLREQMEEK